MKRLIEDVKKLVSEELERANMEFGSFNSAHEGQNIIREEVDEVRDEFQMLILHLENLWGLVKSNDSECFNWKCDDIKTVAINLSCEAIQVAAMAEKFKALRGKENGKR